MRACFAVLLTVAAVSAVGKHDDYIKSHLQLYDLDNYIVESEVSVPDVIVNKHTHIDSNDIKKLLQDHAQSFAQQLVNTANANEADADLTVIGQMPFPISAAHQLGKPDYKTASQDAAKLAAAWRAANPNAPGAQIPLPGAPGTGAGKKRSVEAVPKMNLEATIALYQQAVDFLDKYDVELRFN